MEVYNITCGVDDLVVGDCDVTEPRFVDNRLQQGYIYRITITPRSNGQDAQNGTSNTKEGITNICLQQYNNIIQLLSLRLFVTLSYMQPSGYDYGVYNYYNGQTDDLLAIIISP